MIHCHNGKDYWESVKKETDDKEMLKKFLITVMVGKSEQPWKVSACLPGEVKEVLKKLTDEVEATFPFDKSKFQVVVARLKGEKVFHPVPDVQHIVIDMPIGAYVKIVSGPYPEVMKNTIQRVDARKMNKVLVTRWYSRKSKMVSAWVPLESLEVVKNYVPPKDSCVQHSPNKEGSAEEAFARNWCRICGIKDQCQWYKTNGKDERRAV